MKLLVVRLVAALVLLSLAPAYAQTPGADPFQLLRDAYAKRDAEAAARAYAPDAVVTYAYAGAPEESHRGRAEIARSFETFFSQFQTPLDLNFRVGTKTAGGSSGVYRLRFGDEVSYGRFKVSLGATGLFASDTSSDAVLADFERLAGPTMFNPDEEDLDRTYYGALAGRYRLPNGCLLVVTRSVARIFVRDACTQQWRGLTRVSGLEWTGGDRVRSGHVRSTYLFTIKPDGAPAALEVRTGADTARAARQDAYRTEAVTFRSGDGVELAGTLYLPKGAAGRAPASVMVHGSGPQDRDGYASIIAVLADELAANGRVVLAYDKRGSGASKGDGDRAGFDTLADDAIAGMRFLRGRPDVDPTRVGLAGSSQAGWVTAKAVERGGDPADVFLLARPARRSAWRRRTSTTPRCACGAPASRRPMSPWP